MTQAFKRDPYADVSDVIAEETSRARIRVHPTPKTPTESGNDGDDSTSTLDVPELGPVFGYHIDGDKRYQER